MDDESFQSISNSYTIERTQAIFSDIYIYIYIYVCVCVCVCVCACMCVCVCVRTHICSCVGINST